MSSPRVSPSLPLGRSASLRDSGEYVTRIKGSRASESNASVTSSLSNVASLGRQNSADAPAKPTSGRLSTPSLTIDAHQPSSSLPDAAGTPLSPWGLDDLKRCIQLLHNVLQEGGAQATSQASNPRQLPEAGLKTATSLNQEVNQVLDAVGKGPGACFDASAARMALLQLYVCKATTVLNRVARGRSRQSSSGSDKQIFNVNGCTALAETTRQLEQLVHTAGAQGVPDLISTAAKSRQECALLQKKLLTVQEDNTLLKNTLAQRGGVTITAAAVPDVQAKQEVTIKQLQQELEAAKQQVQAAVYSAQCAKDAQGALSLEADTARHRLIEQHNVCEQLKQQAAHAYQRVQELEREQELRLAEQDQMVCVAQATSTAHKETLDKLQSQHAHLQDHLNRVEGDFRKMEVELAASRAGADELCNQLHMAKRGQDVWEQQARLQQTEVTELRQKADALQADKARVVGQLQDDLANQQAQAQASLNQLRSDLDKLRLEHEVVQGKLSESLDQVKSKNASIVDLEARIKELTTAQEAALHTSTQLQHMMDKVAADSAQLEQRQKQLDDERAHLAELKRALQADAQAVQAMGTLVQTHTLRFDIGSLLAPLPPTSAQSEQSRAAREIRPASGVADPNHARLSNLVRELQAEVASLRSRLTEQQAQAVRQAADAWQSKVATAEQEASQLRSQLQTSLSAHKHLQQEWCVSQQMLDATLQELKLSGQELSEAKRLLSDQDRTGLTAEARSWFEAQLVAMKKTADDKTRLAAGLSDQVAVLQAEVKALSLAGQAGSSKDVSSSLTASEVLDSGMLSHVGSSSATPSNSRPASQRSDRSASSSSTSSADVACQTLAINSHAVECYDTQGHVQGTVSGDNTDECHKTNSVQLRVAHESIAMLTAQLADAEETIKRQDKIITGLQVLAHSQPGLQVLAHSQPGLQVLAHSQPVTHHAQQFEASGGGDGSTVHETHQAGTAPASQPQYGNQTYASHLGVTTRSISATAILRSQEGVAAIPATAGPLQGLHKDNRPPRPLVPSNQRPWSAAVHSGGTVHSVESAARLTSTPVAYHASSLHGQPVASGTRPFSAVPAAMRHSNRSRPQSALAIATFGAQQESTASQPEASKPPAGVLPRHAAPDHIRLQTRPASAVPISANVASSAAPVVKPAGTVVKGSTHGRPLARPMSAHPAASSRTTFLLLSSAEPSASAGLPTLAQATAEAERFLAAWNAQPAGGSGIGRG